MLSSISGHANGKNFCMHYLQCFVLKRLLENHKEVCIFTTVSRQSRCPERGPNSRIKTTTNSWMCHSLYTPTLRPLLRNCMVA